MVMDRIKVRFTLNGEPCDIIVEPEHTLLKVLREQLGLTGTKAGCEKGECGACTVIIDGKAVNSCLILATEADGHEVLTIEGLSKDGELDLLQSAFIEEGAVQCGFCTPGMIMSAKALLLENPNPDRETIKDRLAGNTCRCTGYDRIIGAVLAASEKLKPEKLKKER